MNEQLVKLAERIRDELDALDQVVKRACEAWERAQESSDDLYLDSVALNLHSLYAGLERLFEVIAMGIDGTIPQSTNWHRLLLEQMTAEVSEVRPAVISRETCNALDEYRGFRHVVRHVYTFKFDPTKVKELVRKVPVVFERVRTELSAFADFLEQRAGE